MKTTHFYWLTICALVVTGVIFSTGLAQQGPAVAARGGSNIGVCNVVELFTQYSRAAEQLADLKEKEKAIEREKKAAEDDFVVQQKWLTQNFTEGTEEYEKQFATIRDNRIQLEVKYQAQRAQVLRTHQLETRQIYDDILDAITDVAEQKGLSLVIYSAPNRGIQIASPQEMLMQIQNKRVLYSAPGSDITAEVLTQLNRNWKNKAN